MTFSTYKINKRYTDKLKESGYKVNISADVYCGPIYETTENGKTISFFAPINDFDSKKLYIMTFKDNIISGIIDCNYMIPCFEQFLEKPETNDSLAAFCKDNQKFILMCAEFAIKHDLIK